MKNIPSELHPTLKHYVYLWRHPGPGGRVFYIGKGVSGRAFDHLSGDDETEKGRTVAEIRRRGKEPVVEILRYGLTADQACLVEAAAIDLFGLKRLTNRVRGNHGDSYGRVSATALIETAKAKPVEVKRKALLIRINKLYREDMSKQELYEATRGIWRLNRDRCKGVDYALAVYQGVVKEVYRINVWHPAGTTEYKTREVFKDPERVEFTRRRAEGSVHVQYLHRSVRKYFESGTSSPVVYIRC